MNSDSTGYYQEVDEAKDDYISARSYVKSKHNWNKRNGRKPTSLFKEIEIVKATNKSMQIGDNCYCPICKEIYIKSSYQQVYCGQRCRVEFDRRRWVKQGHKIK